MTQYEKRVLFEAIQRVLEATSPGRKAAVILSDWMEDADPDFEWEPERDYKAKTVSKAEWRLLNQRIKSHLRPLLGTHPDQRFNAAHSLGKMVGLNEVEISIFQLVLQANSSRDSTGELCELLIDKMRMERHHAIALVVGCPAGAVRRALSYNGHLFSTGLIENNANRWSSGLNLDVSDRLAHLLENGCNTPDQLCHALFPAAPEPVTEWEDFKHLGELRDLSSRILKGAIEGRHTGINLLFYGPAGTGKTEFCKALAQQVGQPLHTVGETDEDGNAPNSWERSGALQLAQRLLAKQPGGVLLFDEMEDILKRDFFTAIFGRQTGSSKIHLHRTLETNPVPVLWTTNDIENCDPALLRRMTLAVEVRAPGPQVRERVWTRLAARKNLPLGIDRIQKFARDIEVPPALVAGAFDVARLTEGGEHDLALAIGAADKALRGGHSKPPSTNTAHCFNPALLVTNFDVDHLLAKMAQPDAPRNVSFCFSGPPGTGKSAFARHLADVMGLPVIQKRASDLLSRWVGGSEKAIAAAFSQACEEGAFLIFDEADSLLGNRAGAIHSWEISKVNEMLTWMESHPLPFACTTNLADHLDPATRRRFAINAELHPLSSQQLAIAFRMFFQMEPPAGLFDLEGLTPGDMASVVRRCNLLGEQDRGAILAALSDEARAKGNTGIRPGFRQYLRK